MSTFGTVDGIPLTARSDLRAKLYHIARHVSFGVGDLASASGTAQTDIMGVIQTKANSGHTFNCGIRGETQVVAGAAVTVGVLVTTDSSGRAIAASSGDWTVGQALQAASAGGEQIRMLLRIPAVRLTY